MNFVYEQQTRRYLVFLGFMGFIMLLFVIAWHGAEKSCMNRILLKHEENFVTSLLEQGASEELIADAYSGIFSSNAAGEYSAGRALLEKLGLSENRALEYTNNATVPVLPVILVAICFLAILFAGTCVYLGRREKVYKEGLQTLESFAEGDFSKHLPGNREGTLYAMFLMAERLAMSLKNKEEEEHQSKEFLKETISDISHQLKTPLAALRMYNEIVEQEPENAETVAHFTDKSADALQRMEQLIQTLLKVTRLDVGSIPFICEPIKAGELVQQAIRDLETRASRENKTIELQGDWDRKLICDEMWTGEAIGNLVKNALDHTEKGGKIVISWEQGAAMFRLMVADDGTGISAEDIHHIFKRFYRGKAASEEKEYSEQEKEHQGIGLGLPLAKAIIEGQGGLLSVQSEPGKGSIFTISFLTEL